MTCDTQEIRAFLAEHHDGLATELHEFCQGALGSLPACHDDGSARRQAKEIARLLGDAGWVRYAFPATCGGHFGETDLRACALIREALGHTSPLADSTFALQCLGAMPMVLGGSDALRARWLPQIIDGRALAAFAMTEPEAGSDVLSMSTAARRDGDCYVLDGRKHLITNAGIADVYTTFAVTDASQGHRGISCFAVPATAPGLRFVGPQVLSEPHPLGEIAFEACRIPADCRIGPEGHGFKLGMATLDRLRPTVAAAACGMAGRALEEALEYAMNRRQFGQPLAELQMIQAKLASMKMELTAARLMVYRAAWTKDMGAERITLEAAMAKAFATEAAQRIIDQALQILGGRGMLSDHIVERLYRAIRPLRIYEGTTEVQHLIIARHLCREEGG